ncbi:MAG TPA: hypothetical protein VGM14_13035 [Streptosporangiaceae bacterium]|jgi:hypothetical protein
MLMMIIMAGVATSLPIVGIVLVSLASRREDAAFSLGGPARSPMQLLARRVVDFSSEARSLPLPKSASYARPVRQALAAVEPLREDSLDTPRIAAATGRTIRPTVYRSAA